MIDIRVAFWPILLFSLVIILLPIISKHVEDFLGCLHLLEASVCVVLKVV